MAANFAIKKKRKNVIMGFQLDCEMIIGHPISLDIPKNNWASQIGIEIDFNTASLW